MYEFGEEDAEEGNEQQPEQKAYLIIGKSNTGEEYTTSPEGAQRPK